MLTGSRAHVDGEHVSTHVSVQSARESKRYAVTGLPWHTWPLQAHGGAGVSQDFVLARLWTAARTLRIADGPDEVHLGTIAKMELGKHSRL